MENLEQQISHYHTKVQDTIKEIKKIVVGQDGMINRLLVGLFTGSHILLEGVPGLAKTLTVNTLARVLDLDFKRIQFTPDLLPADIVGTMIYNPKEANFEVKKGPIFTNIILADEINRSPAKVQSALLEAMQEKQVTIGEETFNLEKPFLVLATQNPVEQEGTYPLPEAQVDRFILKVFIDYPNKTEELKIMRRMSDMNFKPTISPILSSEDIRTIKGLINQITIDESLESYVINLVFASRYPKDYQLENLEPYIQFGASPRASINLRLAAKTIAFLNNRDFVKPEDIKDIAYDVMGHRLFLTYEAEAENKNAAYIIKTILEKIDLIKG